MVEEADVLLNERDTQLLSGLKDRLVVLATSWSRDVLGSGPASTEDIINEGELADC